MTVGEPQASIQPSN